MKLPTFVEYILLFSQKPNQIIQSRSEFQFARSLRRNNFWQLVNRYSRYINSKIKHGNVLFIHSFYLVYIYSPKRIPRQTNYFEFRFTKTEHSKGE